MANQKEIRVKIGSTKKTMKITSAMKLVAAAKVNKMQKRLLATRPYSAKITELFNNLVTSLDPDSIANYPMLNRKGDVNTVLLVVVSSDRGLCGAYNTNIIKAATKKIASLQEAGKNVKLITIGRKARAAFSKTAVKAQGVEIIEAFTNLNSIPTSTEANLIANKVIELYLNGAVDKVEIITTRFISLVNSVVETVDFLPIKNLSGKLPDARHASSEDAELTKSSMSSPKNEHNTADGTLQAGSSEPYVIFDPNAQTLIETLAPMYIENKVYQSLQESTTSELAARMTAMSNATNNAKDVIKKLTLAYNKARQASITQEISEIVGGAAALSA